MNVLLVAATALEIQPLQKWSGSTCRVDTLITGVSGVPVCYALLKKVQQKQYDILLQAGIAGTFTKSILPGAVVAVQQDSFADVGVVENKVRKTMFDLQLMSKNATPFKRGQLINPHKKLLQQAGLKQVNAITVNEITTAKADLLFYKTTGHADIESMEGAAFHYVALMEKIPFLQIRSISNNVGERDKSKWQLRTAIENLNLYIATLLNRLS